MEYENCKSADSIVAPILLGVVILVLLIILYMSRTTEKFTDRADEIMTALDVTLKESGNIIDFKRAVKDPKFSPTKYIHLTDLYRRGALTKEAVNKVLDDASI